MALLTVGQGANCALLLNGITNSTATFQDTTDQPFRASGTGFGDVVANPNLEIHQAAAGNADAAFTITARASNSSVTISPAAGATHNPTPYLFGLGTFTSNWTTQFGAACTPAVKQDDLIIVVIDDFASGTISTVTDTSGNTYALATSGTNASLPGTQSIYYAKRCKAASANTNFVQVTYTAAIADDSVCITVIPVTGADINNPIDTAVTLTNSGNSITPTSVSLTTSYANLALFGACMVANHTTGISGGYTNVFPSNDVFGNTVIYQVFATKQSGITVTTTQATGQWLFSTIGIRAASDVAGFVPVEVEPRGRGRAPIQEESPVDPRQTPAATSTDIASYAGVDVERRGRSRVPFEPQSGTTQTITTTDIASYAPVEVEPRGKGRQPIETDLFPKSTLMGASNIGWVPVEVDSRGKGRPPLDPELPPRALSAPTLDDIASWAPVEVDPRGKGRRPLEEDPPLKPGPLGASNIGWVSVDVEPRGRGRFPIPEDAPLERPLLGANNIGWVSVDVEPRGKGRAPLPEDPPLEPFILKSLGWIPVDVEPRGRGRAPLAEEPPIERPLLGASNIGWVPVDVEPRGRGRFPLPEDPTVEALRVITLLTTGWVPVDVEPRGKGRLPIPEEFPVETVMPPPVLRSIGWMEIELTPRRRGPPPLEVDALLGPSARVFPPVPPPPPPATPTTGGAYGGGNAAQLDNWWAPIAVMQSWGRPAGTAEPDVDDTDAEDAPDELDEAALALAAELTRRAEIGLKPSPPSTVGSKRAAEPEKTLSKTTAEVGKALSKSPVPTAEPDRGRTVGAPAPLPKSAGTLPKSLWIGLAVVGATVGLVALSETPKKTTRRAKYPPWATLNERWNRCGKPECQSCPHGPYYYMVWRDRENPEKLRSVYVGRRKPR